MDYGQHIDLFFLHKGYGSQVAGIVPLVEQDTIPDNLQVLKLKRV